ncbi:MAG: hypothetical protein KDM91_04755 [Verrucomicrobiae bacterium]|nr:hypothetical protein [Verrucomicrobiae bacterium]MCP5539400.1 hypothetical protein [Akkermansiaceae bacterium]MCP5551076.1 hypothetical protein [Akkermansiaceae bacterium]
MDAPSFNPGFRFSLFDGAVLAVGLGLGAFLIWRETRLPAYHGVLWRRWNPALPEWWAARQAETASRQNTESP